MSRKTKAELEAENRELKDRNDELQDRNENLQGYIKLMHGNFDEDRRHLEIEEKAHDACITNSSFGVQNRLNSVSSLVHSYSKRRVMASN